MFERSEMFKNQIFKYLFYVQCPIKLHFENIDEYSFFWNNNSAFKKTMSFELKSLHIHSHKFNQKF